MNLSEVLFRLKKLKRFNLSVNCTKMNTTKDYTNNGKYIESSEIDDLVELIKLSCEVNSIDLPIFNTKKSIELEIKRCEEIGDYDAVVDLKQQLLNMKD